MSNPPPDVREVIDDLAERLLARTDGEQIPDEWTRYLLERLALKPRPRGRPRDLDCLEMVAYEMAFAPLAVEDKRRIAKIYSVNVRTINNMQRTVEADISELDPAKDPEEPGASDEEHAAVMQGIAHAIDAEMKRKDKEEARRRKGRLSNERWLKLMEVRRGVRLGKK